MASRPPTARTLFVASGLGWIGGSALQLQQPGLWTVGAYLGVVALALALLVASRCAGAWMQRGLGEVGRAGRRVLPLLLALGAAAMAFGLTGLRADARLAEALAPELEGRDLKVVGVVAGLPRRGPEAWRFMFEVESARLGDRPVALPGRLSLGWYANTQGATLPVIRAGQRWALTLRLKRPHGASNPHGFDYELLLFEQGVRATGYVRTAAAENHLLTRSAGHWVDRARQSVREAIEARVTDPSAAGLLAALAVGDQAAIERDDWALYRDTGVAHLMSISGLHVTMFAWLAGLALNRLWRLSPRALRLCPAPRAARWGGLAAACAYAVFAGWGVPAQRTALMLATTTLLGAAGLSWGWPLVWGAAAVVVTLFDPWALLQPGFWLSFVAVGLLMGSGDAHGLVRAGSGLGPGDAGVAARQRTQTGPPSGPHASPETQSPAQDPPEAAARGLAGALGLVRGWAGRWAGRAAGLVAGGLRTQLVATLGLAPLTLVFFQQISLVGFVANLVAIPLVTLLITPLALLGVLWAPLWSLAALAADWLSGFLHALAALPGGIVWTVPAAPAWAVPCALLGAVLALLPLPWRVRVLAVPLLLPLLAPPVTRPQEGAYELTAADVGQGTAVLVRTARHTLLYDAGPQYSRESDAGERVLLPLLRALGERRLDLLMLSHRDTDHVGGAEAVLRGLLVDRMESPLEPGHALLGLARARGADVAPCEAGRRWRWDGVDFEILHPGPELLARSGLDKTRPNALSCVLRVVGQWGGRPQRALLTGDIEREQEAALVTAGSELAAEVLIVPHHGSKTSSSEVFLDAVAPRVAVVQAGYRNRFGHPAAPVLARYAARGIEVVRSPDCGAWRFGPDGSSCWRALARRYWHHPEGRVAGGGSEVANSASTGIETPVTEPEAP